MEKLMKVMFAIGMALSLTHCAEKKDNNQAGAPAYGQYYLNPQTGQCASAANPNMPVPSTYCQGGMGGMGGQYYMNQMGQCVSAANPNLPVPSNYCQGGMGGGIPQVCMGQYYYCPYGAPMGGMGGMGGMGTCQLGMCQVNPQTGLNNCSGYTLYNQSFQPVTCQ